MRSVRKIVSVLSGGAERRLNCESVVSPDAEEPASRRLIVDLQSRMKSRALWPVAALLMLSALSLFAQPTNDNFASPIILTGPMGITNAANTNATFEAGETSHNCQFVNDPGGSSVWFQWTAPADGTITFDTVGSDFDTVLAVYTGNAVNALTFIVCNDGAPPTFYPSTVSFNAVAGTTYHIVVDGYFSGAGNPDGEGNIVLRWRSGTILEAGDFKFTSPFYLVSESESFAPVEAPLMQGTDGARLRVTRTGGSSGRVLVNYTVTNGFYTNRIQLQYIGSNTFMTNIDANGVSYTNIWSTNTVEMRREQDNAWGTYYYLPLIINVTNDSIIDENGNVTMVTTNLGTNIPAIACANTRSSNYTTSATGTNITFTQNFCRTTNYLEIVPAAVPFQDFFPVSGTLVMDDFKMGEDILVPVFPNAFTFPPPRFVKNRVLDAKIDSVMLDPLESTNIGAPTAFSTRARSIVVIHDTATLTPFYDPPATIGTNVFGFERATLQVTEDGGGRGFARVWVFRDGFLTPSANVMYRIDFLPPSTPNGWNVFNAAIDDMQLQPASDYAQPTDPPGNVYAPNPDFTSVFGTLDFPAPVVGRPIDIPIFEDSFVEFNEDFQIELFFDAAATDKAIGYIGKCVVTILFDEQPAGAVDRTHNPHNNANTSPPYNQHPGANGTVYAVAVQPDGKCLIGGDFTAYNTTPHKRIARMNADGQVDTSFLPPVGSVGQGVDGFISAIALQQDGKVIIGGAFSSFNSTQRGGIARLNANGSLDTSFNPGLGSDGIIWSTLIQPDNKILVAGQFNSINNVPRARIARLNPDGSVDSTFDPGVGPDDIVFAMALQPDGRVIIGGQFTSVNGVSRNRVARLNADGTFDASFDPASGADDIVYALGLESDGKVIIGGSFSTVDQRAHKSIARLNPNGTLDETFESGSGANDTVYSVAVQGDGRVMIAGIFTVFNETRRVGLARLFANGELDTSFMDTAYNQYAGVPTLYWDPNVEPHNYIFSSALQPDGNLIIGGGFRRVGGGFARDDIGYRDNVARVIGGFTPGPGNIELVTDNYTADENGDTLFVTMSRNNGSLGPASVTVSPVTLPAGPGAAMQGVDFNFDANTYGNPTWISAWPRPDWQLQDALFGQNNGASQHPGGTAISAANDVYISILDNSIIDGTRQVNLELSKPNGTDIFFLGGSPLIDPTEGENIPLGVALGHKNANVNIIDNDAPPGVLGFSSATYSVLESTNAVITVTRTNGSTGLVTVQYSTTNGTATAGAHYRTSSGRLTFGPGETNKTFTVPIIDETAVQGDHTVILKLFTPTGGASLGLTNAVLTIIDNDFAGGYVEFSSPTYKTNEDSGFALISVTRNGGSAGALSVGFQTSNGTATNGPNYSAVMTNLSWANGDITPRTVAIPIFQDGIVESNNLTVNLRLYSATLNGFTNSFALGSVSNSVLTIMNMDFRGQLSFSTDTYMAAENGGAANITIVRRGGSAESVTANFSASDATAFNGIDYLATNGTFSFGPGEVSKTFTVPVIDNNYQDPANRFVTLTLSGASPAGALGSPSSAILNLIDDESVNEPPGSGDTGFSAGVNDAVHAMALQPDGRLLVAGDFTYANGITRTRIARLQADGTLDFRFEATGGSAALAGANASVLTMLSQSDGRILIGGAFTNVNGVALNHIARLNYSGPIDNTFDPGSGMDYPVFALAETFTPGAAGPQSERKLLVGGGFTLVGGVGRNHIARLNENGTLDMNFNPGLGANGNVYAIALQTDGKAIIGGDFTSVNGIPRGHIARLNVDGSVDMTFLGAGSALVQRGANDSVRAIAIQLDGRILIGGLFTNVNGVAINRIARLQPNGFIDSSFNPGPGADDLVQTIAIQPDTRIVLGGTFTHCNGVSRNRITRLLNDGSVDPMINFGTGANSFVAAAVVQTDGKIVIGGGFTEYDGVPRDHLARIYGNTVAGAGTFEFTSGNYEVREDGTNALITIRRRGGTSGAIPVSIVTSNGTALNGTHYTGFSGTLNFPAGETFQTFTIPVLDDLVINPDRYFNISLSPGGGAAVGNQPTTIVTIVNDDSGISFSAPTYSVSENNFNAAALISISRFGSSLDAASVDFFTTTNGTAVPCVPQTNNPACRFTMVTNTVTFGVGETNKIVLVPINNNNVVNGDQTVQLALSNSIGALLLEPATATLTIVDDDSGPGNLRFSVTNFFLASETGPIAVITVNRTNGTAGAVSVNIATGTGSLPGFAPAVAGINYVPTNGTLVFANGELSKTFGVRLLRNPIAEGDKAVPIVISNPTGGAGIIDVNGSAATQSVIPLVIQDADTGVAFSLPAFLATETSGQVVVGVRRIGNTNSAFTVSYGTSDDTAHAGTNYIALNGSLNFNAGESQKSITLGILHDPTVTGNLTFVIGLSNATPGTQLVFPTAANVLILDGEAGFSFTTNAQSVVESATNISVTVVCSNPNLEPLAVHYATADGTARAGVDYAATSGTLVFTNGAVTNTFTVPILNNSRVDGDRFFTVSLLTPTPPGQVVEPSVQTITILDKDSGLSFSSPSYTVLKSGVAASISVVRTGTLTNTVTVAYTTQDGTGTNGVDYIGVSGTLVFTNGDTVKSFSVPVIDDNTVKPDKTVLLLLTNAIGDAELIPPSAATLIIHDNSGSLVVPAGSALTSESFAPPNGYIEPGENVTVLFALRNSAGRDTTNLVATLLATNGVTAPSGPQNYGALVVNGPSVSRPFTFTANGTNGQQIIATFRLQDGAVDAGLATFTYILGTTSTIFSNSAAIIINDNTNATPYPSTIAVSGVGGVVRSLTVKLTNVNHTAAGDVDMLLVSPGGQKTLLMANAGGGTAMNRVTLTFDDAAANSLPQGTAITTGSYKPTAYLPVAPFPAPAPPGPYSNSLAAFTGTNPNGTWSLYAIDDASLDVGIISNGWSLAVLTADPLPGATDLSAKLTASPNPVILGSNLTYTIVVTNHGPSAATTVTVTDTLPGAATFVSAQASQGSLPVTNGAGLLTWNAGALAKDAFATITIVVRPTAAGSVTNSAFVAGAQNDPNASNNIVAAVTTVVVPTADLALGVVGVPNPVTIGNNVVYGMSITNLGPAAVANVAITNTLPPNVSLISASPGGYTVVGNVVTLTNIGALGVGGRTNATIVIRPLACGTITNSTTVGAAVTDPLKANNTVSVKTIVEGCAPATPPALAVSLSGNLLTISWPASASTYVLERATSLTTPIGWQAVTNPPPQTVGSEKRVTLGTTNPPQFFRLRGTP